MNNAIELYEVERRANSNAVILKVDKIGCVGKVDIDTLIKKVVDNQNKIIDFLINHVEVME